MNISQFQLLLVVRIQVPYLVRIVIEGDVYHKERDVKIAKTRIRPATLLTFNQNMFTPKTLHLYAKNFMFFRHSVNVVVFKS